MESGVLIQHVNLWKNLLTSANIILVNLVDYFHHALGPLDRLTLGIPDAGVRLGVLGLLMAPQEGGVPAGDGLVGGVGNGAALALLFLTGTQTAFGQHNLETNITHTES